MVDNRRVQTRSSKLRRQTDRWTDYYVHYQPDQRLPTAETGALDLLQPAAAQQLTEPDGKRGGIARNWSWELGGVGCRRQRAAGKLLGSPKLAVPIPARKCGKR